MEWKTNRNVGEGWLPKLCFSYYALVSLNQFVTSACRLLFEAGSKTIQNPFPLTWQTAAASSAVEAINPEKPEALACHAPFAHYRINILPTSV